MSFEAIGLFGPFRRPFRVIEEDELTRIDEASIWTGGIDAAFWVSLAHMNAELFLDLHCSLAHALLCVLMWL